MKNLLLILVLSLFSIQSFAGGCPDGSEPVKSISDDGTYFVYNCGGQSSSSSDTNAENNSSTSSKKSLTEIKKSMDDDGILQLEEFHALNAPQAINPVSVSDFSIIGKTSIRFESNHGECGQEQNWSDCDNDRERAELNYEDESWKIEKWYRFYLYLPKDYNSIAPAKMSLIQWRSIEPSLMLITFQHMHAGLIFQRNGDAFPNSNIALKSNEDLLGNWTEIIFNTNWHPDPEKGFMKVWIDGKLKVDINATAHYKKGGKLNLRYGLYSSYMSNYKNTFNTNKMPQRIAYYDGVKAEKNCQKLLDINTCNNLISQNINEYTLYLHNSDDKELHSRSICKISNASFESASSINDFYNPAICPLVKSTNPSATIMVKEKSITAEASSIETTNSDPTISKVIEVIQGDKFIVEIAEPHELAGTNLSLNLRDIDAPDAVKSCPKQLEFGNQVKDFVAQKIAGANSIKITNFRKTSKAIIGQIIIDDKDLGAMLIQNGYASDEYGYWKGYFCSALQAIQAGNSNYINGDYEESIFWYERALVIDPDGSNNSQATYDLSKLYRAYGDDKKSLDYLKQSAGLNYIKAQEDLGSAYLNGMGVSKNLAQAKKWLKKAHDNGSKRAEGLCGCDL